VAPRDISKPTVGKAELEPRYPELQCLILGPLYVSCIVIVSVSLPKDLKQLLFKYHCQLLNWELNWVLKQQKATPIYASFLLF